MRNVTIATFVIWFMVALWSAAVLQKTTFFFKILPVFLTGAAASFVIINDIRIRKK